MTSSFKYLDICFSTIPEMKRLLFQRNQTLPQYVDWKYGPGSPEGFRGVVAFDGNQEVGCFGSIPLTFIDETEKTFTVGWFADWYVLPSYQGRGLGKEMLTQLSQRNQYHFGHPGPKYAYNLCVDAGWKKLAFQSKYRWMFFPIKYYRQRSKNWINTTSKILLAYSSKMYSQVSASIIKKPGPHSINRISISLSDRQKGWVLSQPCIPEINREYGEFTIGEVTFLFFDQILPKTGEVYRKLVLIEPFSALETATMRQFLLKCRNERISYLELLIGSPEVDLICRRLGGTRIPENPIVYTGFADNLMIPNLQGMHRENWLFQAGT